MKNKSWIKGSKILVTGGCGFIGSHLVRKLSAMGADRIVIIDSLKYGDMSNIGGENDGIELVRHTIGGKTDDMVFEKYLKGMDYLFHLAAEKHNQSIDDPLSVLNANLNGTFKLFKCAAESRIKKVIFSSSLYAYGRMNHPAFSESEIPGPRTVYGISKLTGEHFLKYFYENDGLKHVILRYLFVYGPRQYSGMGYKSVIVNNFERLINNNNPIIFGDGRQVLDYIYINDVVDATISAAETEISCETYNVGSSIPTSINELTDLMIKISGKSLKPAYGPKDSTHGTYRVGDISKIKRELNFHPSVSLEDGLKNTFSWMNQPDKKRL
jgi:UDP-glucose 4-epimerase